MKKFTYIALAALAVAFISCDEYTLPNPPAQSNAEEAVFAASDLTVTDLTNGVINLPAAIEANTQPQLLKFEATNIPTDRSIKFVLNISTTEDFAKVAEVATSVNEENIVSVSSTDLQTAYASTFSHNPEAATLYVRYAAYVTNATGSENARVGGPDTWFNVSNVTYTPVLLSHAIEEAYYLVGSFNDWNISTAIPFTKLNEGNQYDEPDFFVNIQVSADQAAAGYSWKVLPASAVSAGNWDGAFGAVADAEDTRSGSLVESPEAQTNAGVIAEAGSYQISINMLDLTYKVSLAYDHLWIRANGYYSQPARMMRLYTSDYVNYKGVMRANRTFSLLCQASTAEGVGYGTGETPAETDENGITKGSMALCTDLSAVKTMEVPAYALYLLKANLNSLTWEAAPINSISLVGAFNGWNTNDETAVMTPSRYWDEFTISNVTLPADEFKFCANHAWTISFGGSVDNIVENGGNIKIEEAGTYDIVLHFNTVPNSVTITKK